jgi:hypothetical protein
VCAVYVGCWWGDRSLGWVLTVYAAVCLRYAYGGSERKR